LSELDLRETPQASRVAEFLKALSKLEAGEVLTAFLGQDDDPERLVAEAREVSRKWDFQKHRQGDDSWLVHAKLSG
jgi:uncharacterized protein (DUF2249 family)